MPTNSALTPQKFSISFPSNAVTRPLKHTLQALKSRSRARFAAIAGVSFALTLPALGVVDPKVLMSSSLSDARSLEAMLARGEAALRSMEVMGLFATGGVAVLALAAMAGAGYLRARYKAAQPTAE
ncbi:hypothetical protein [Burkholderia ubonensis]|uniref:hypothetical protein n=1 Tax=Burkholderia ubonensis TaxID=101571 RepID=UPI00075E1C2E|nr:hypothetical protein [Burkholderia ubonensis]KVP16945.1 hypothetical protein WJ84_01335 [Burkholderia ubonensis]